LQQGKRLDKAIGYTLHKQKAFLKKALRRAIQTALITTELYLQSSTHKILALPLAQEATDKPANTPSALTQLKQEFGDRVDWRRCMDVYVDYNSNAGTFAPNAKSLRARALELCRFLRERDEKEIVVVSHGDFLHYCPNPRRSPITCLD
jgi:hypothetical protein